MIRLVRSFSPPLLFRHKFNFVSRNLRENTLTLKLSVHPHFSEYYAPPPHTGDVHNIILIDYLLLSKTLTICFSTNHSA